MGMFDWLSPTAGADQGNMGLMGMLANPQTAGLLGMAGGLLQASGPSRLPVSNGMALGSGFQGMQQGMQNAIQNQRQMLTMQAMQGLMGGGTGQSQASAPSMSALGGPNSTMPATMGGSGGSPDGSSASGAPQAAPAGIYGRTPQQLFQQGMLMNMAGIQGGGDLMRIAVEHDPTLAMQMPTDISKMGYQGGMTPAQIQAANAAGVAKANYIAPVNARPGAILRDPLTMQPMAYNPNIPAGGTPVFDASGNVVGINSIPGAADVAKTMGAAGAIGKAYGNNTAGYVNGQPAYVNQGALADRLTGGGLTPFQAAVRSVESGGRPDAVNPASGAVGSMQTMPTTATNPGFGVRPAQDNSPAELQRVGADYATAMQQKYGNDTDAAVAYNWGPQNADKWIAAGRPWNMLPKETQGYVGQVMTQMNNYRGQAMPTPELPPGAQTAANASQGAPAKQMADMQGHLSDSDNTYQASRTALQKMIGITQNGGFGDAAVRLLPENVATRISNDAAEYQKAHANFVSLQGKALGAGGTDTSRGTLDESVPTFDKPTDARLSGLNDQLNQLDWNHLKRQTLNPVFQQGNEKSYTQQSAAFDNAITPAMMPQVMQLLNMPAGPERGKALQAAAQNPQMKAALDIISGQFK